MIEKFKIALIYKPSYPFLTGEHFDNTTYDFFIKALPRNENLEITYFASETSFDVSPLNDNFDVILLPTNDSVGTPDNLIGIEKLKIPVISRVGDPHDAIRTKKIPNHEKYKIDYYFNFMLEEYFYKFYPKHFKYKTIVFGVEPSLYQNIKNFKDRISNRILNSGAVGKTTLKSRLANKILNPKRSSWYFYKLRSLCNNLPYVVHTGMIKNQYVNNDYPALLSKYKASIAATTFYPTIKYWEISAAGCLPFMEITDVNHGKYLGYEDDISAIFINQKNYKKKFEQFLSDPENEKWEKIAENSRNFTLKHLTNDSASNSLVELIKEII